MKWYSGALLLGLFLVGSLRPAQAQKLGLTLFVEDPHNVGSALQSTWVAGQGLPDGGGKDQKYALYQQEYANTEYGVGVGGYVTGLTPNMTLTELGFDVRNDGHCGAGAPRFNVWTSAGVYYFFGCYYGSHTPAPDDPSGWTRIRFRNQDAYPAYSTQSPWPGFGNAKVYDIWLAYDEGLEVGPGFIYIDNIDISGKTINKPK